ncbi:unnamed protein product [Lampetra fluviatilis]
MPPKQDPRGRVARRGAGERQPSHRERGVKQQRLSHEQGARSPQPFRDQPSPGGGAGGPRPPHMHVVSIAGLVQPLEQFR